MIFITFFSSNIIISFTFYLVLISFRISIVTMKIKEKIIIFYLCVDHWEKGDMSFCCLVNQSFMKPYTIAHEACVYLWFLQHYKVARSISTPSWAEERRGGLMVSALSSGSSGLGLSPGWGQCVMFLGKTLNSDSASLH